MRIWTVVIVLAIVVLGLTICGCGMQTDSSSSPLINLVSESGPGPSSDMNWTFRVAAASGDDFKIDDGSIELMDETGIVQIKATSFSKELVGAAEVYTASGVSDGAIIIIDNNNDGVLNNGDMINIDPDPGADWTTGWEMILKYQGDTCYSRELD